jgi:CTP:molybdopterin cytidylyltransferase MocA
VGAAAVTKKYGATLLEVDDVGCILDVDTVYDLARAEQLLLSSRR